MSLYHMNINRNDDSQKLIARLIGCLPAATFEMETLCRLAGIKTSREVQTAAVECLQRPRMLLNPDFVAQFCKRDEHLFLLVMHELWHIILAHTRLYPRVTQIHNIAFDAIINAGLSRQFSAPEYRGFFDAINPPDSFPALLLRPPIGWPENPEYPTEDMGPPGTREIMERLYPQGNRNTGADPLYEEILDLLRQAGLGQELVVYVQPVLLGDHEDPEREGQAVASPLFTDAMKELVGKWPKFPIMIGRGLGGPPSDWYSKIGTSSEEARRAFAKTLRRCLGPQEGHYHRRMRSLVPGIGGMGVVPNARDRMVSARKSLGVQGLLWNQPGLVRARVHETPSKAHVYLDVSGSMIQLIPHLLSLIMPYVVNGQADVFQFSTYVEHMSLEELRKAHLRTSGGTDINCVLIHALDAKPHLRRALILTDGYTGVPRPDLANRATEQNLHIYAVLPAESASVAQLKGLVTAIIILPPLGRSRSPWNIGH